MSELTDRNRAVWSAGDWDQVANYIETIGPQLLDLVGIEPGMRVLDVGTGSGGNVAIPAAQRGAAVTGVDLTDRWFDDARRRASAAGVEVEWVVGDAEALPVADGAFDRVLSTFGHIFAPHHEVATAELVRACAPGGTIGFSSWRRSGYSGEVLMALSSRMPPPPPGAQAQPLWGERDHITQLFAVHGLTPQFTDGSVYYDFESEAAFTAFFAENFGPMVIARGVLGDAFAEFLTQFDDIAARHNEATDGRARLRADFLLTTISR